MQGRLGSTNLIPGNHVRVGENQLYKIVPLHTQACWGICALLASYNHTPHTHINQLVTKKGITTV